MAKQPPISERAEAATEELRETLREAHGLIKDLRAANATASRLLDLQQRIIDGEITSAVADTIHGQIRDGLANFNEALGRLVVEAEERINRRFDRFISALLGEESREGRDMEDIVKSFLERQRMFEARVLKQSTLDPRMWAGDAHDPYRR